MNRIGWLHGRLAFRALLGIALGVWSVGSSAPEAHAAANPRYSHVSPVLVGTSSGLPTPEAASGEIPATTGFEVDVRDDNNAPVYGRLVVINLSLTGVRLSGVQESGCTLDCAAHTLTKTSGGQPLFFHARFGGSSNQPNAEITAAGVVLGDVPARSTDMDAEGGTTGLGDFARFMPLFLDGATNHPEADFDASGGPIGLSDFAIFAREYLLGAQGAYCP